MGCRLGVRVVAPVVSGGWHGMVEVLRKFGVPNHLCSIITRLHKNCTVKLKIGDTDIQFDSTIGVKQGDNLAPILFLFMMQAVMETLKPIWPAAVRVADP